MDNCNYHYINISKYYNVLNDCYNPMTMLKKRCL